MTQNIWGFPSNQSTTFNEALGYKKYVALLTQTGTDAPVATVLENTLGSDVVWNYEGTGQYYGENSSFADGSKVFIYVTPNFSYVGDGNIGQIGAEIYDNGSGNSFFLATSNSWNGTLSDNWGTYISVEIRVYP